MGVLVIVRSFVHSFCCPPCLVSVVDLSLYGTVLCDLKKCVCVCERRETHTHTFCTTTHHNYITCNYITVAGIIARHDRTDRLPFRLCVVPIHHTYRTHHTVFRAGEK